MSLSGSVFNESDVSDWSKLTTSASGWQGTNTLAMPNDYWFKKTITAVTPLVLCRTLSINDKALN